MLEIIICNLIWKAFLFTWFQFGLESCQIREISKILFEIAQPVVKMAYKTVP